MDPHPEYSAIACAGSTHQPQLLTTRNISTAAQGAASSSQVPIPADMYHHTASSSGPFSATGRVASSSRPSSACADAGAAAISRSLSGSGSDSHPPTVQTRHAANAEYTVGELPSSCPSGQLQPMGRTASGGLAILDPHVLRSQPMHHATSPMPRSQQGQWPAGRNDGRADAAMQQCSSGPSGYSYTHSPQAATHSASQAAARFPTDAAAADLTSARQGDTHGWQRMPDAPIQHPVATERPPLSRPSSSGSQKRLHSLPANPTSREASISNRSGGWQRTPQPPTQRTPEAGVAPGNDMGSTRTEPAAGPTSNVARPRAPILRRSLDRLLRTAHSSSGEPFPLEA